MSLWRKRQKPNQETMKEWLEALQIKEKYYYFLLWSLYSFSIAWGSYSLGYSDARVEYTQSIKYRCIDGTVYRSTTGYLEKTNQNCIPLDNLK
jgi:hypothetical protein